MERAHSQLPIGPILISNSLVVVLILNNLAKWHQLLREAGVATHGPESARGACHYDPRRDT